MGEEHTRRAMARRWLAIAADRRIENPGGFAFRHRPLVEIKYAGVQAHELLPADLEQTTPSRSWLSSRMVDSAAYFFNSLLKRAENMQTLLINGRIIDHAAINFHPRMGQKGSWTVANYETALDTRFFQKPRCNHRPL